MQVGTIRADPSLKSYIQILQRETRFKAKVIYTLSCIQNVLSSSPSTYNVNVEYLSRYKNVFSSFIGLYGDSSILEPLADIFYRFQLNGVNGACKQFLDYFEKAKIEGERSDRFIEYVCKMLNLLKHRYPNTKPVCLKLLENGEAKLTEGQTKIVLQTMTNSSAITKEEFKYLGKFSKINIPPTKVLELMWRSGLKTNGKKGGYGNQLQESELDEINGYLAEGWSDEAIKYACVRVCLWNSTSSSGVVESIFPDFLDRYLKKSLKPFYPLEKSGTNIDISKSFQKVIEHCSNEYHNENLSSQISEILPIFSTNKDYACILASLQQRTQISGEIQIKYSNVIDLQFLTNEDAMLSKLQLNRKPSYAFKILKKLQNMQIDFSNQVLLKICVLIVQIYLCNKKCKYLKQIEWILSSKLNGCVKKYMKLLQQSIEYIVLCPFVIKSMKSLNSKQKAIFNKSVDTFMVNEAYKIQFKFFVAAAMVKLREEKAVHRFISYLLTKLNKDELPYEEILFYIKNCEGVQQDGEWLYANFEDDMERILEKIFGKLVAFDFKAAKQIIFALQKFEIFGEWLPMYGWTLNPLDDPNFENPDGLTDSLQIFETVVENCKSVPIEIIKKFFEIVSRYWGDYNHEHMFTIERICEVLFGGQELGASEMEEVCCYLKKLMDRQWKVSNSEIYRLSLGLLISTTIMEETQQMGQSLTKIIFKLIASADESCFESECQIKSVIFAQEIVMWRFQYEQITIHNKVGQVLFRIVNNHDELQINNQRDREMLVRNSLQIISSIGHECNLLELKLVKVIRNYICNTNIVQLVLDVLTNVKQVNVRAILKFQMQTIIPQILLTLILSQDEQLNKVYVNFLKQICLEETPYKAVIEKNKNLVLQILRAESVFVNEQYCDEKASFVVQFLKLLPREEINERLLSNLWLKYYTNEMVRNFCEEAQPTIAQIKNSHIYLLQYESIGATEPVADEEEEEDIEVPTKGVKMTEKKHISEDGQKQQQRSKQKHSNFYQTHQTKANVGISMAKQVDDHLYKGTRQESPLYPTPHPNASQGAKKQKVEQTFGGGGTKIPKANLALSPKRKKNSSEKQMQMEKIKDIKSHVQYVSECENRELNEQSLVKLRQSLKYLTNVVGLHPNFCQKIVVSGAMNKCLCLHPSVQKTELDLILDLFEEIAENKEKNIIVFMVFNGTKSIDFLKTALNSSIQSRKDKFSNEKVINIIQRCWNSSAKDFLSNGLLGTLFQMVKMNLSRTNILEILLKNDLSSQIVDQIYQKDLFNVMQSLYKTSIDFLEQNERQEIIDWATLIGKVVLNHSQRQKLFSMNIHELAFAKLQIFQELSSVNILAKMFANFTKQFDQMAAWLLQKKIPEYFLRQMETKKQSTSSNYYLFFKCFLKNGKQYFDSLFKIKLHVYMIQLMKGDGLIMDDEGFKNFFQTLSHFFTLEHYKMFLKSQIVVLLLKIYFKNSFNSHDKYILQCLQSLVEQIQDREDVEMLEKQGFFTIKKVFNEKGHNNYHHVIQMYITLLRKFKNFNPRQMNFELIAMVIKRVSYYNLEGSWKVIELINQLSEVDKVSYGNAGCQYFFSCNLRYKFGRQEICFFFNYLILESKYPKPERPEEESRSDPMSGKNVTDVPNSSLVNILIDKYLQLRSELQKNEGNNEENQDSVDKIITMIMMFLRNKSSYGLFEKIKFRILSVHLFSLPYYFESSLEMLCQFSADKDISECIQNFPDWDILEYIKSLHTYIEGIQETNKKEKLICGLKKLINVVIQKKLCNPLALRQFIEDKVKTGNYKENPNIQQFLSQYKALENQEKQTDKMTEKVTDKVTERVTDKMTDKIKQTVTKGIKVKMYKFDGSNSSLILFFKSDLLELNCVVSIGEPVKEKWRLKFSQINGVEEYQSSEQYKKSVFYLSEGIFTKAPPMENCLALQGKQKQFCICFESNRQLKQWKTYIEMGIERAIDLIGR